jgi:ACS family glucarate transporter-like MFS transporter
MTQLTSSGGRVRWLLVGWIFVIASIAFLDRVNISIAGKYIQQEFHLDNVQLGWIFSAFVAGYALFQAPGGRLADRFGPRRVLAIGALCGATFTTLTALVPSSIVGALALMIAVRVGLGLGEAVIFPGSNRLVAAWIPSRERGLANGLIFAGVGAGAGLTPPLITYIMSNWGWRTSFFMTAPIEVAVGVIWYLLARDKPETHPWVGEAELQTIQAGLPKQAGSQKAIPLRVILASRDLRALSASYFCYGYVAYIFFTWFFLYLSNVRGLNLKSSAFYGMLPFLAMATCSPLGGWISDKMTKRFGKRGGRGGIAIFGLAMTAIFLFLGMQAADVRLASIVLAGGAGALYLSQSSFWSVTADLAGRSAGTVSGLMNMCNQVGGVLTASLTPIIANHFGWNASFLVAAVLCVVGALSWLFVDPTRVLDQTESKAAAG